MKVKICGIKYKEDLEKISQMKPDFMGFIFYDRSKRYMKDTLSPEEVSGIEQIKKVGVFVNEVPASILEYVQQYGLDAVQLHGDESPEAVSEMRTLLDEACLSHVSMIKAFGVGEGFNFNQLKDYKQYIDCFLFDTKTTNYGGSGRQFNWDILEQYDNEKPFMLSGGIGLEALETITNLSGLNICAIDMNSKLEVKPGKKDIHAVSKAINFFNETEHDEL